MISALGRCVTNVAHLKQCANAMVIGAETGGCEQTQNADRRAPRPSCKKAELGLGDEFLDRDQAGPSLAHKYRLEYCKVGIKKYLVVSASAKELSL